MFSRTASRLGLVALCLGLASAFAVAADAPKAEKPAAVTAAKLAEAYVTDPAAFDKEYKDKVVEVTGLVELPKVDDRFNKKSYVTMAGFTKKGAGFPTIVRCEWAKGMEGLKPNQKVTIRGTVQAHEPTRAAAELQNCTLVK
ncbi:MAG TPA: hypothetical protein VF796_12520 [Humisphaera sp.]